MNGPAPLDGADAPGPSSPPAQTPPAQTPPAQRSRVRRLLWPTLGALAALSVLAFLLYRERAALQTMLQTVNLRQAWRPLLLAQALMLAGLTLAALVWAGIMRALGSPLARVRHISIYAASHLGRYLPGTVWYVVGRSALYRRHGESARLVTLASGLELAISVMAGALVALALLAPAAARGVGRGLEQAARQPAYTVALAVAVAGGVALLHPRTVRWLLARLKLGAVPPLPLPATAGWLALYALIWVLGGAIVYLVARLLAGAGPDQFAYLLLAWTLVGTLSVVVFFLPSNFGLTEVGLSLLLSAIMPSSVAVLVAVATRVVMLLVTAVGCGLLAAATAWALPKPNG